MAKYAKPTEIEREAVVEETGRSEDEEAVEETPEVDPYEKPKVEEIDVLDLRPCANCNGEIVPWFMEVRVRQGVIDINGVKQFVGLSEGFGFGPGIASVFASKPGAVILDNPDSTTRFFLCQNCYLMEDLKLARVMEKVKDNPKQFAVPM